MECLRLRSELEFQEGSEICLYHYHNFHFKADKVCCNPLKNHYRIKSTRVKTTLKEFSLEFAKQYGGLNLITGHKLCYRCKKTIEDFSDIPERDDKYDNDDNDTDCSYEVEGNVKSAEKWNKTLTSTDCSPLKKVWKAREVGYGKRQFKEAKDELASSFSDVIPGLHHLITGNDCDVLRQVKEKLDKCHTREKGIQLFTLIPEHWSRERAVFQCH